MRIFAVIYIALGILYHLITGDGAFTWSDPWLYVTIGLWPIFFLGWVALAFGIFFVGYILYDKYKTYTGRTPKQKMVAKRRREYEAERRREKKSHDSTLH